MGTLIALGFARVGRTLLSVAFDFDFDFDFDLDFDLDFDFDLDSDSDSDFDHVERALLPACS